MNDEEIKEVVKDTIDVLLSKSMIKYSDQIIYESMSDKLREYYRNGKSDPLITEAIEQLKDNQYIDMLSMYYGLGHTLEDLAEYYYIDISTVVRNKKSLCIKIFNIIN